MKKIFLFIICLGMLSLSACKEKLTRVEIPNINTKIQGNLGDYASIEGVAVLDLSSLTPQVVLSVAPEGNVDPSVSDIVGKGPSDRPFVRLYDKNGNQIPNIKLQLRSKSDASTLAGSIKSGDSKAINLWFEGVLMSEDEIQKLGEMVGGVQLVAKVAKEAPKAKAKTKTSTAPVKTGYQPMTFPAYIQVTGTHVRLRWSPSLNGAIYSNSAGTPIYPANGEVLYCTGAQGDWNQVEYNGNTLYISRQFSQAY